MVAELSASKRRRSKRLRAEAASEFERLVPAAHAAGIPIAEIGKLADLSRPPEQRQKRCLWSPTSVGRYLGEIWLG